MTAEQIREYRGSFEGPGKEDPNGGGDNGGGEEKPTDPIENDNKKEQDIIEKLNQEKGQGMQERKENIDWQKNIEDGFNFDLDGYIW